MPRNRAAILLSKARLSQRGTAQGATRQLSGRKGRAIDPHICEERHLGVGGSEPILLGSWEDGMPLRRGTVLRHPPVEGGQSSA